MSTRIAIALTFAGLVGTLGAVVAGIAVVKLGEFGAAAIASPAQGYQLADTITSLAVAFGVVALGGFALAGAMAAMIVEQIRKGAR